MHDDDNDDNDDDDDDVDGEDSGTTYLYLCIYHTYVS